MFLQVSSSKKSDSSIEAKAYTVSEVPPYLAVLIKPQPGIWDELMDMDIMFIKMREKKVAYVPESVVTINSPDDWHVFREWSIRQTSLLLSKSRSAYYIGILLYGSSALLFIGAVLLSVIISISYIHLLFKSSFIPLDINLYTVREFLIDQYMYLYVLTGI